MPAQTKKMGLEKGLHGKKSCVILRKVLFIVLVANSQQAWQHLSRDEPKLSGDKS